MLVYTLQILVTLIQLFIVLCFYKVNKYLWVDKIKLEKWERITTNTFKVCKVLLIPFLILFIVAVSKVV